MNWRGLVRGAEQGEQSVQSLCAGKVLGRWEEARENQRVVSWRGERGDQPSLGPPPASPDAADALGGGRQSLWGRRAPGSVSPSRLSRKVPLKGDLKVKVGRRL